MREIILKKRYPLSREEDITDAFMRGYEKGKADRPKHYCADCKFEPIDKRWMPCSSCTNNPKNRDAFVSCEVERKGADDEVR